MMKRTAQCLLLTLCLTSIVYAAEVPTEKLNIGHATVFLSGAELISTSRVTLAKGENEIKFSNVAGNVNDKSIVVNATNGVVVESVTFQNNFLATDNVSPKAKELKDSIEQLTVSRQPIANKIATLNELITIIQANRKSGTEKSGASVAELQKLLELVNAKMENYLNDRNKQEALLKKLDDRIARIKLQLDEEQKKNYQPGGQLLVKFYSTESTSSNITITYIVPNAGWSPTYDIWADDVHSPVKFYYKANIYQNSGVQWNNVRLTLSTGNPQEGMEAPVLNPWYLGFYLQPLVYGVYKKALVNAPAAQAGEDVFVKSENAQAAPEQSSMDNYVTVDNSGVNTSFDIDLPYTIPSDGQQHVVAVKKYETPASYSYFAIPKVDKDAFLIAKLTGWEDLNLLPGQTNIFYEGTYVGNGSIDPNSIKDTMNISLGRDKKVVLKKERDKKLRSVKTIGTNVREAFTYNITVRNTRKETVTIMVEDQQPVSTDKDLVIEDQETGGSAFDATTGSMKWLVTLKPNETQVLRFGYTLKYPKGKVLNN